MLILYYPIVKRFPISHICNKIIKLFLIFDIFLYIYYMENTISIIKQALQEIEALFILRVFGTIILAGAIFASAATFLDWIIK